MIILFGPFKPSSKFPLCLFPQTSCSAPHLKLGKSVCLVAGHLSIDKLGEQELLELRPMGVSGRGGQCGAKEGDI